MSSLLTDSRAEWDLMCPSCSVVQPGSRLREVCGCIFSAVFFSTRFCPLSSVSAAAVLAVWSLLPGLLLIPDPSQSTGSPTPTPTLVASTTPSMHLEPSRLSARCALVSCGSKTSALQHSFTKQSESRITRCTC